MLHSQLLTSTVLLLLLLLKSLNMIEKSYISMSAKLTSQKVIICSSWYINNTVSVH